jgi:hypothetical protein
MTATSVSPIDPGATQTEAATPTTDILRAVQVGFWNSAWFAGAT